MSFFRFRRYSNAGLSTERSLPRVEVLESRTMLTVNLGLAHTGLGYTGYYPPDTIGAVGPNHFVEAVNLTLGFYDKSTGSAIRTVGLGSFFSPLGGVLNGSDPDVTYDTYTNQFVVGMIDYNNSNANRYDFAVSNTSDPTGSWTFHRYDMTHDTTSGSYLNDYPRLGYNADAYVVTFNMFPTSSGSQHVDTLTIRKSDSQGFVYAWPTGTVNIPGMAPAVVHDGSPGGPVWLVGTGGGTTIKVIKMTNEFSATPTFNAYSVGVQSYGSMPAPHDPGGVMTWNFDTRIFNPALRDNLLVAAQNIGAGGNAKAAWYEFNVGGASPTLVQQGRVGATGVDTYFPTIDINTSDDLGMTYIESSSSEYMSMYVTGHTSADPPGGMEPGALVEAGNSHYSIPRAGDYSGTSVDPSDGTTFWSANEYKGSSTWNTGFSKYTISSVPQATHFEVDASANPVTAGTAFSVTVTALDANNNVFPGYLGTVHFTSDDNQADLNGDYTFTAGDAGVHTFTNGVTLKTAGNKTVTVSDTVSPALTGSATVTVLPTDAARFTITGFSLFATAGQTQNITVTAKDPYGNTATGYAGTVTFTSNDPQASLPADGPLTSGVGHFSLIFYTAGRDTLTATDTVDSSITGSGTVTVNAAALDHFAVYTSVDGGSTVAGNAFDIMVVAQDAYNNTVTGYRGTVTFSSADPYGATLPPNYQFQASDAGQALFPGGGTLYTAGIFDVTATDTVSGLTGSDYVYVTPASAVAFNVIAPSSVPSGSPFDVTVVAVDPYGNTDTNYGGTVQFSTSDPSGGVMLPPNYSFQPSNAGMVTFFGGVTLITVGNQTVTVTDIVSGINGTANVTVTGADTAGQSYAISSTATPGTVAAAPSSNTAAPQRAVDVVLTDMVPAPIWSDSSAWPVDRPLTAAFAQGAPRSSLVDALAIDDWAAI
jgi:hypothetical protein